jgi:hypothetical protein
MPNNNRQTTGRLAAQRTKQTGLFVVALFSTHFRRLTGFDTDFIKQNRPFGQRGKTMSSK